MSKDAYTIGEIARIYHIGTDTIRYYERKGLLEPVRGENGYRYYSGQSIWRMNVIRNLRGLGFSVDRIRDYFQNRTARTTEALLREELPGGAYLSIFYRGPTQSRRYLDCLRDHARARGLELAPPFLEIIWQDIHTAADPEEFISEVQARIREEA